MREDLSSRFPNRLGSSQAAQLKGLVRILKFCMKQMTSKLSIGADGQSGVLLSCLHVTVRYFHDWAHMDRLFKKFPFSNHIKIHIESNVITGINIECLGKNVLGYLSWLR